MGLSMGSRDEGGILYFKALLLSGWQVRVLLRPPDPVTRRKLVAARWLSDEAMMPHSHGPGLASGSL